MQAWHWSSLRSLFVCNNQQKPLRATLLYQRRRKSRKRREKSVSCQRFFSEFVNRGVLTRLPPTKKNSHLHTAINRLRLIVSPANRWV